MLLLILVLSVVAAAITFSKRLPVLGSIPFRTGLDIQGGARVVLRAKTEEYKGKWDPNTNLEAVRKVLENRVNATGVSEPQIITKPPDQIIIELPGLKNEGEIREQLKSTASLQFYLLPQLGDKEGRTPSRWTMSDCPTQDRRGRRDAGRQADPSARSTAGAAGGSIQPGPDCGRRRPGQQQRAALAGHGIERRSRHQL